MTISCAQAVTHGTPSPSALGLASGNTIDLLKKASFANTPTRLAAANRMPESVLPKHEMT